LVSQFITIQIPTAQPTVCTVICSRVSSYRQSD